MCISVTEYVYRYIYISIWWIAGGAKFDFFGDCTLNAAWDSSSDWASVARHLHRRCSHQPKEQRAPHEPDIVLEGKLQSWMPTSSAWVSCGFGCTALVLIRAPGGCSCSQLTAEAPSSSRMYSPSPPTCLLPPATPAPWLDGTPQPMGGPCSRSIIWRPFWMQRYYVQWPPTHTHTGACISWPNELVSGPLSCLGNDLR